MQICYPKHDKTMKLEFEKENNFTFLKKPSIMIIFRSQKDGQKNAFLFILQFVLNLDFEVKI